MCSWISLMFLSFWRHKRKRKKNSSILPNLSLYLFIHLQIYGHFDWLFLSHWMLNSIAFRLSSVELCVIQCLMIFLDFGRYIYLYMNVKIPSFCLSLSLSFRVKKFNNISVAWRVRCVVRIRCYLSCFSIKMVASRSDRCDIWIL